jgi:hypothetical protein
MNRRLLVSTVLLATVVTSAQDIDARDAVVQLVSPKDGETLYMPHPHFRWQKGADARIEDRYEIQISSDEAFHTLVVDDSLDVVSRFVCPKPLPPGTYFWRLRRAGDVSWTKTFRFTREDSREYKIKAGALQLDIAATLSKAAANTPAKVSFEQGDYRITDTIPLRKVRDLILDGNGSRLTLETSFLDLKNCADITVCNLTVRPAREPSTHVDVLAVDPAAGTLTVQVKPGFPEHFPSYFKVAQRGNTIMRVVDEVNRGRSVTGWGSGGGEKRIEELGGRRYRIHGLPAGALKPVRTGMTAYAKSYGHGFGNALHVTRLTLSKVTFLGMPGSIWGDREMNANSCLSCGFLPLSSEHYTGASGVIGNGRIGSWFEDCRFGMGADDNVMDHVFPWPVDNIRGNVAILKHGWMWPQDIRKGDEFVLWDCMSGEKRRTTRVTVLEVQDADGSPMVIEELNFRAPRRLVLSKNTMELNLELGRPEGASFQSPGKTSWGVMDSLLLIRLSPNNQDFVFRRNEVVGGSAGMLNNTTRALVADNTFRNLRGPAVHVGFRSAPDDLPAEGCGSRDYVIRDNKMENCGAKAIRVDSDAGIGGNIIIKNNTISYSANLPDTLPWWAITVVGNNDGVVVKDNLFKSARPPSRGSWINSRANDHPIHHSNNRIDTPHANVPMLREE